MIQKRLNRPCRHTPHFRVLAPFLTHFIFRPLGQSGHSLRSAPIGKYLVYLALVAVLFDALLGVRDAVAAPVPPPFEPVRVETTESHTIVSVWGRQYRFAGSPIPQQIESQGQPLLSTPASIEVAIGRAARTPLTFGKLTVHTATPDVVEFRTQAIVGQIRFEAKTRIEYDGMILVRIEATSQSEKSLTHFSYDFPLNSNQIKWFNHHVPYDYSAFNVDKPALLQAAGAVAAGLTEFEFAPTFFLGGRTVGIELWWETNLDWSRNTGFKPIAIERTAATTSLRVTPISAPRSISAGKSFVHEFAVFPTPMRAHPDRWRSRRFVAYHAAHLFAKRPDLSYHWIAFPAHFSALYHGFPGSRQDEAQSKLRRKLTDVGVGFIPYAKLTATPSGHPRALSRADDWSANRQRFVVPPPEEKIALLNTTEWKPGQPYGYAVCAERKDFLDWVRDESLKALKDESLDGLYYDWGAISRMCERASNAPNKTDVSEWGRTRPEFWHYLNIRKFYKELYQGMQETRPESILTIHSHGQPRALAAWVDYNFIGEALIVVFRGENSFTAMGKNPSLYTPDYLALPDEWMNAMTFPHVGGITSWLPELKFAQDPTNPERLRRFQRAFFAWVLANDAHIWIGNGDFPEMVKVYAALDQFGSLDEATVTPWWAPNDGISADHAGLKLTTYSRPDAVLVVASNLTDSKIFSKLSFSPQLFPGGAPRQARNLELPGQGNTRAVMRNSLRITVPAGDFKLFLLER